jgi:Rod binding domain-containing protein
MDLSAMLPMTAPPMEADPQMLASQLRQGDGHSVDAVATSFESMFLSMMMKEMRQTLDEGGFFGEDKGDVYGGLFDLYLGQHLAQAGGIGIANLIRRQLETKQK